MQKSHGFSLVELSIVLVILGLLVGGILAGQSLVRTAELRSVIRDMDKYRVAVNAFKDKYFAVPGDMRNAYSFWSNPTTCTTNATVTNADASGCNGNADGVVDINIGESFKFWLHLSKSGLIEGKYDGWFTGGQPWYNNVDPGRNVPSWGNRRDYYYMGYNFPNSWRGWTGAGSALTRNYIAFSNWGNDAIAAVDAWNLDTKLDDGKPGTGAVTANITSNCTVGSSTDNVTATYDVANNPKCGGIDMTIAQ